jgi:hypothetical protein
MRRRAGDELDGTSQRRIGGTPERWPSPTCSFPAPRSRSRERKSGGTQAKVKAKASVALALPAMGSKGKSMKLLAISFCMLAALSLAEAARADSDGEPGKLVAVEVLTADSDDYTLRHGRIIVQETTGKVDRTYLLGGTSLCPNQEVSDAQIDMLVRAAGNPKLVIKPFFKVGNGNSRCLVGFALGAKKQVAEITHF